MLALSAGRNGGLGLDSIKYNLVVSELHVEFIYTSTVVQTYTIGVPSILQ